MATTDERRAERASASFFVLAAAAALGLALVYWRGGNPQLEGALLGVALGAVGAAFVIWGNHLMPQGPEEQERKVLAASSTERDALAEDIEREGVLTRRTLLVRAMVLAGGALGVAAVFPIRSLGPRPGNALLHTDWRDGLRLVNEHGRPVRAGEVPADGLVTVFPEGHAGSATGQAVLMRVPPTLLKPARGREDWAPDGLIVYSKICSHAGCPVGLYQATTHSLLCPCHQSAFDVLNAANPVAGPAAWPLPQLPIRIDPSGYLVASGDFSAPVGPGYWKNR